MIKATNLTKSFKSHDNTNEIIFRDIDFEAKAGVFTIIQGKSGSGKTTLLNIISTIDSVNDGGELIINEQKVCKLDEHNRAKFRSENIGFIFQSYALIPEFNIIENCTIPLTMAGVSKSEATKTAKKLIKQLISDADENFYLKVPTQLSGGQQQRVSIARALIHNPKIIIADEPTANLDEQSAADVKKYLCKLAHEDNICVIVVTHEKDYLKYADVLYEFEADESKQTKSILKAPQAIKASLCSHD